MERKSMDTHVLRLQRKREGREVGEKKYKKYGHPCA
jgi:hypothetical protein